MKILLLLLQTLTGTYPDCRLLTTGSRNTERRIQLFKHFRQNLVSGQLLKFEPTEMSEDGREVCAGDGVDADNLLVRVLDKLRRVRRPLHRVQPLVECSQEHLEFGKL